MLVGALEVQVAGDLALRLQHAEHFAQAGRVGPGEDAPLDVEDGAQVAPRSARRFSSASSRYTTMTIAV